MLRPALLILILATPALASPPAQAQQLGAGQGRQTGTSISGPSISDPSISGPQISGDARMGLVYDRAPAWAGQRETGLRMTARTRLHLEFLGQTDGGLNFGAGITLDSDKRRPTSPWVAIGG
jgi:hypothetical protein